MQPKLQEKPSQPSETDNVNPCRWKHEHYFFLIIVDQVNRVHRLQQKIIPADIHCVCDVLNSSMKNTDILLKTLWSLNKHRLQKPKETSCAILTLK